MKLAKAQQAPRAKIKDVLDLLVAAGAKWSSDNVPRLSAAVSFYAALSLAPFLIIGTVLAVYFVGTTPESHINLVGQAQQTLGQQAADLLESIVHNAQQRKGASVLASLLSFVVMFFSASNLFLQFDDAVRSIWGVHRSGSIVKLFIRSRLTAFASVIVVGVGLIAWLYLDSRMAYMAREAMDLRVGRTVSFLSTFLVLSIACCFSMKRLASVRLTLSDVLPGALLAAFSISVAKYLLSLYFANSGVGNVYGPAGALLVILLWIYYCSQIYFFGIEVVFVYASKYGSLAEAARVENLKAVAP